MYRKRFNDCELRFAYGANVGTAFTMARNKIDCRARQCGFYKESIVDKEDLKEKNASWMNKSVKIQNLHS